MGGAFQPLPSAQPMGSAPGSGAHLEAAGRAPESGAHLEAAGRAPGSPSLIQFKQHCLIQFKQHCLILYTILTYYSTTVLQYKYTAAQMHYTKSLGACNRGRLKAGWRV